MYVNLLGYVLEKNNFNLNFKISISIISFLWTMNLFLEDFLLLSNLVNVATKFGINAMKY